ncbi:MAG: porphobilinogen synthase [Deltaproteobacteria bacterium]|nr:porphobilinogen synthase [Deltaproteobacteria bacterium]MBW1920369.1 porphobilinogen synthase [Deltaproteobacteria bacterium]MBW1932266.1 porphobilinogen synthase [Deltaproteobacteria bacterium]MBW1978117.1 porphobilinogen synthase [Deltaproteobacteria bacterium]MBW2044807.1 porphobilinogen synthase [Deltaproteobacteria bacterium]
MIIRPRRLRRTPVIRDMVRETTISVKDLIYPLFVKSGKNIKDPIASLPGQFHFSVDTITQDVNEIWELGIPAVILFGIPDRKDSVGSRAYADDGVVQSAISAIKKEVPEIVVITDVCLCEYTDHGHCGIIKNGQVDNDATIEVLALEAVSHARAGADIVAPSDMMDGRVAAIREALDGAGFKDTGILSYAVKYASAFYGPFREAADSAPQYGDRKGYQMDPANAIEALKEASLDIDEGADMIMVKPALPYLDIITRVREQCLLPLAAYNVSGEYAMVKAAGQKGWIDAASVMMEMLTSIKRAGADLILTYFAKEAAKIIKSTT